MAKSFREFLEYQQIEPSFTQAVQDYLGVHPKDQSAVPSITGNTEIKRDHGQSVVIGSASYEVKKIIYGNDGRPSHYVIDILEPAANALHKRAPDGTPVQLPDKSKPQIKKVILTAKEFDQFRTRDLAASGGGAAPGAPPGGGLQ
jgi:hypothetical protein